MLITDKDISGKVLDHLGLVSATIEKIGLIEKIDRRLPLESPKTSMGQRVAAMIYNGLGFIDDRLYMFPEFLSNKPVDRLFRGDVKAEQFNDDALGRCLDSIYDYGVTKLFSEVAFEIGIEQKLLGRTANIDTTSLSLYGDYEEEEEEELMLPAEAVSTAIVATGAARAVLEIVPDASNGAIPAYGYAKNKRNDLKQMVLTLATSGAAGFPVWMEAQSGNAPDAKIMHEASQRMKTLCKGLKDAPAFMTVGDSAIYDACVKQRDDMLWLTRVPERHKAAKELLQNPDEAYGWSELADGYKICILENKYQDVHQRWAVVFSQQAYNREIKTFNKLIESVQAKQEKALWHLGKKMFQCEKDAKRSLQDFAKQLKLHGTSTTIEPVLQHKGKGKPGKNAEPTIKGYKIKGHLTRDEDKIALLKCGKGRFVLATNQLDRAVLPDDAMLSEYKGQSKTESGFKFIKDDAFEVSSVFLKKPERIAALMMIMTLCLMVYALSQYELRQALAAANDTIPSQTKKQIANPSMKWVYRLFFGVQVITLCLQGVTQEIVINLKDTQKKIVRYFGTRAMQIYGVT